MDQDLRTFVYRIDARDTIIFVNREWVDFARENQAPELTPGNVLGQPLERFIDGWETRHLYELIYQSVRRRPRQIRIPLNCDSPTVRRAFVLRLSPLEGGVLEFAVQVVEIRPLAPRPILDPTVARSSETIAICSWCKRIRTDDDGRWGEIECALAHRELFGPTPPSLTHGVCPDCFRIIRRQLDEG